MLLLICFFIKKNHEKNYYPLRCVNGLGLIGFAGEISDVYAQDMQNLPPKSRF